MLFAAAALCGCEGDYDDWAAPQTSPAEEAQNIDVTLAPAADIDMAAVTEDSLVLFTPTLAAPTGMAIDSCRVTLAKADDETQTASVLADGQGRVAAADLVAAVAGLYGRRPEQRTLRTTAKVYMRRSAQAFYTETEAIETKVTLSAPHISEAYHFTWGSGNTTQFTHSSTDVYDDPVFTVTVQTTEDNVRWQIASQEAAEAGTFDVGPETDGSTALSGTLVTENAGAGVLGTAGYYRITIDMWDRTYSIEQLNFAPYIYEVGNNTGWSSTIPLAGVNYDGTYTGYAYLDGEFKFKPNPDGNWDGDWEKASGDALAGTLDDIEGGPNIDAPETGFYQMNVNLVSMTYSLLRINTIGIVGSAAPGGWDVDTYMTYDVAEGCWVATLDFTDGAFKFRANDGWDINWGGSVDDLASGGADIPVTAGNYTVRLYLSCEGMHTCTMTRN